MPSMTIKEFVAKEKEQLSAEVAALPHIPHLVIIQANDSPASDAYVRGKIKDCDEVGARATLCLLPPTTEEDYLLGKIAEYNEDEDVDGIIVQLPLPSHISEAKVKLAVDPKKDVDGFHPLTSFVPCTPKGIVDYLTEEGFPFVGKNAVVLGRSEIVGKPMAKLLLSKHCNVTVLHSRTTEEDKAFYIAHADLIVVAIGRLGFLDARFKYKPSAVIVDVGINRNEEGKLRGDAVAGLPVALQTPVPGGVGLLTRLALVKNLIIAAKSR
ncbi:MAG: bifunctional 5,10-methylenetetrahydrofolate dehydrogenase/5,10-methenyltetrahydrofolate cyclohydrolase [Bacilli bacterium]|nr:bifunctional 5,10-methylenetetrahydrofolate dehydrogenase/5,10-methenyltetrahydrofolate cyclohydrolase [Bacilli bacterium]